MELVGGSLQVVDRMDFTELTEVGGVDATLEVWIVEVENFGICFVFVIKCASEVELVDAKIEDSVLDLIGLLGKVVFVANVVDSGIQRGASSKTDFVVVSRSAEVKEFSFFPPVRDKAFGSSEIFWEYDPSDISACGGLCEGVLAAMLPLKSLVSPLTRLF